MNRKEIARETLKIQRQGFYELDSSRIDMSAAQKAAEESCFLLTLEQGVELVERLPPLAEGNMPPYRVTNQSTAQAIAEL